jgi:hypothetical protein
MQDRRNVRVLVFPADDAALRGEVESALGRASDLGSDAEQAEALRTELQPWYRSISVQVRDAFGGYDGDPVPTWYVYRDGRVRARNEGLDRLYQAMAVARETCRSSAVALEAARSVAHLAGYRQPPPRTEESAFGPAAGPRRVPS